MDFRPSWPKVLLLKWNFKKMLTWWANHVSYLHSIRLVLDYFIPLQLGSITSRLVGTNRIPYINCQAQFFNYNCSSIKHRFSEFLPTKCRSDHPDIMPNLGCHCQSLSVSLSLQALYTQLLPWPLRDTQPWKEKQKRSVDVVFKIFIEAQISSGFLKFLFFSSHQTKEFS